VKKKTGKGTQGREETKGKGKNRGKEIKGKVNPPSKIYGYGLETTPHINISRCRNTAEKNARTY